MAAINFTLRTRIYLSMLAIIMISFIVTGSIAIYDHYEQNEKYNLQRLLRKEKAVKSSLDYFLNQHGGFMSTDSVASVFSDKICELSDVHNLFIVLSDLRGRYLISTNSNTMDSLGMPYQTDYTILKQLSTGNERAVINKNLGGEEYSLAYWYFNDIQGKPIAITNVVYRETETEGKDLWAFLRELGQSYVLLFLLAALAAYLLSSYITRSLQAIGTRMQRIQFGKTNEPLEWRSNDEIGALVKEYNRMLGELEFSANKLAQTERESAWREMAQQVAHEIKNPLTPMKLRVQHLMRSLTDKPENFNDQLQAFGQSMIEQIDALSKIATEFSHFAKLPKPELISLDLAEILKDVVLFFKDDPRAEITFRNCTTGSTMVMADKTQTIRVFNNLVTNALQASRQDGKGKIDVLIRNCGKEIMVRINDNGEGISKEDRHKIFVPNFTTKSQGTGLGLVMVRNIITQSGGRVWFWTRKGKGASFYCTFKMP